jgi:hypothetical protein
LSRRRRNKEHCSCERTSGRRRKWMTSQLSRPSCRPVCLCAEDTDDDILMPEGPPPGVTGRGRRYRRWHPCTRWSLRGACVSRTPVKSSIFAEDTFSCSTLIIVVFCRPATTSTRFSSRNRRHIATTSRSPNTTLPSSPSRIPRATATTATRFPWCYPTGFRPFAASWHPASSASRTPTPTPWRSQSWPITALTSAATCDVRGRGNIAYEEASLHAPPYTC